MKKILVLITFLVTLPTIAKNYLCVTDGELRSVVKVLGEDYMVLSKYRSHKKIYYDTEFAIVDYDQSKSEIRIQSEVRQRDGDDISFMVVISSEKIEKNETGRFIDIEFFSLKEREFLKGSFKLNNREEDDATCVEL